MDVTEHPCIEAARTGKCGPVWFQFTAHGQTLGACSVLRSEDHKPPAPVEGPCKARSRKDKDTGQTVLELLDKTGTVVARLSLDDK